MPEIAGLTRVADVRYTASKDGKMVYAICLVPPPQGETPPFAALKGRIASFAE